MEKGLVQFNKYIFKDLTIDDIKSTCCLDDRCEKRDEDD